MRVEGEAGLWAAVIAQAFIDAEKGDELARRWLFSRSRDMAEVCALAGLDPGWVERMARRALGAPPEARRAPLGARTGDWRAVAAAAQGSNLAARLAALRGIAA